MVVAVKLVVNIDVYRHILVYTKIYLNTSKYIYLIDKFNGTDGEYVVLARSSSRSEYEFVDAHGCMDRRTYMYIIKSCSEYVALWVECMQ
jgi:hypothetical protein